ncbi:MAG TPA: aminotransferase class V-fold PLP-dependent enzyme [Longimicrobiales bacterium]|nr:aminotransferase class V-fold PLP-dependent enzyme [Longimicrobiales bacterium]
MRYYLDYAATSAVRPRAVIDAVSDFMERCGGTPGRGGHAPSLDAGRMAYRCRRALMEVMGLSGDPGRLAYMHNATHGLNTALRGLLGPGDAVVVTAYDHNAVLRPLHYLSRERGIDVRMVGGSPDGSVDFDEVERLLDGARLLVVNAVSNVLGTALPLAELASRAREAGALVLVDAAQSAGHVRQNAGADGADLVAITGHKGLLGPQGTGALWVRSGVEIEPFLAGGTGGNSEEREMPRAMPDRLEAGTSNAPGIAGLLAGCRFVLSEGVDAIHARESALKARLRDGLDSLRHVRVLSPAAPDGVAVVTVTSDVTDPGTLAERLDREYGVCARAGLHCAPEAHRLLGTLATGALRFSLGWASTEEEVDRAVESVDEIVRQPALPVG